MVLLRPTKLLFQLAGDLVEGSAGAGFILFTAGRAADPEGADRLFADLDDDRPLQQQHVRHFEEELRRRRGLGAFDEDASISARRDAGEGLVVGDFERGDPGPVAAQHGLAHAVDVQHHGGDVTSPCAETVVGAMPAESPNTASDKTFATANLGIG